MNKVFVGGLSWSTDEEGLAEHFSKFGNVEEVKIITDRDTGRSRGFGFVTFSESDDAEKAIKEMDGIELDGRTIRANIAEERQGGRGGRGGQGGNNRNFNRNRW
ncbi:MAG: RNA-binding protein [Zetaproteobacteria bacterium]|nr:RNA-binding protein [Pseudobdellovibrionaceae bacterium]|tara:strand:+ start:586 stop:897 length:312 start_codon:yes stop_codon:yes gene_type:complete